MFVLKIFTLTSLRLALQKKARGAAVYLNFDPDNFGDCKVLMQYSSEQARKLAAALILAADEAEKQ